MGRENIVILVDGGDRYLCNSMQRKVVDLRVLIERATRLSTSLNDPCNILNSHQPCHQVLIPALF